jgi:hypothetical protein
VQVLTALNYLLSNVLNQKNITDDIIKDILQAYRALTYDEY